MRTAGSRVYTATVVAVCSSQTCDGVEAALSSLSAVGVRPVMVVLGDSPEAERREEDGTIVIDGLPARYLDNAVAMLRLSSLPTIAWWRAAAPAAMEELAALVEQVQAAAVAVGHQGDVDLTYRARSITWAFPPTVVPARELVLAARQVAEQLDPGGWVVTADDHQ